MSRKPGIASRMNPALTCIEGILGECRKQQTNLKFKRLQDYTPDLALNPVWLIYIRSLSGPLKIVRYAVLTRCSEAFYNQPDKVRHFIQWKHFYSGDKNEQIAGNRTQFRPLIFFILMTSYQILISPSWKAPSQGLVERGFDGAMRLENCSHNCNRYLQGFP